LIFVATKLLSAALSPTALMVALVWIGLLLRRRWVAAAGASLLTLCLVLPVGSWAVRPLEDRFPAVTAPPASVDGIIVLGGAIDDLTSADRQTPILTSAANRLTTFVILAKSYPQARLVFTGGSGDLAQGLATEAPFARDFLASLGLPPDRVSFEGSSRTTWENAIEVNRLVQPKPGETWVLLTSAAHMPRSMGVFRAAGWKGMLAWPVGYRSRAHITAWAPAMGAELGLLDSAAHEWLGMLAYWLQGHSSALFPAP
jgi:uncharacterized SAM-binding protein YcdF (DUF218 family)